MRYKTHTLDNSFCNKQYKKKPLIASMLFFNPLNISLLFCLLKRRERMDFILLLYDVRPISTHFTPTPFRLRFLHINTGKRDQDIFQKIKKVFFFVIWDQKIMRFVYLFLLFMTAQKITRPIPSLSANQQNLLKNEFSFYYILSY